MKPQSYWVVLGQTLLNLGEQREALLLEAVSKYNLTLTLLQDIKAGTVDIADVAVTDDGWKLIPPEPEETHDSASNGSVPAFVG